MTEPEETVVYVEHRYVCSECGEEYPNLEDAVLHQQSHAPSLQEQQYQVLGLNSQENQYQCLECGQLLMTPGELLTHQELHIKLMNPAQADTPKAKRPSRSEIHYECVDCKALFNSQDVWMAHRYTHMQAEDVPQTKVVLQAESPTVEDALQLMCNQPIPGEVHLVAGQQHFHVPPTSSSSVSHTQVLVDLEHSYKKSEGSGEDCAVEVLLYKCSECSQLFQSPAEFIEHQATHFPGQESAISTEELPVTPPNHLPTEQSEEQVEEVTSVSSVVEKNGAVVDNPKVDYVVRHCGKSGKDLEFSCGQCGGNFQSVEGLHVHQKTYQTGPFSCPLCSKVFSTHPEVGEHLRSHSGESHYLCVDCGLGFASEAVLLNHRRSHLSNPLYTCECGQTFLNMTKFLYHRRLHSEKHKNQTPVEEKKNSSYHFPTTTGAFLCTPCGKEFPQLSQLLRHQRFVHALERRHKCPTCSKPFKKRSHLRNHMLTHTGERPYSCTDCSKSFNSQANLLRHRLTHTGEKPHKCQICGKAFSQSSTLQQHLYVHNQAYPYKCMECGINFHRPYRLFMHQYQHTGEYPYKCESCGLSFLLKRLLEVHELGHRGELPLRCVDCGTNFPTSQRLQDHRCTKSGAGEKLECPVCGKKVISDARLNAHVASLHAGVKRNNRIIGKGPQASTPRSKQKTGAKNLECPDCQKTFSTETSLQVHRRIHTGERPYPCPDCGKAFRQSTHLKDHRRLHTGEKPFKCDVCDKAFTIAVRLAEHKRIHTGERPHACPDCGRAYRSFSNLWKHRKLHKGQVDPPPITESHTGDISNTVAILETVETIPIIETVEIFPEGSTISVQDIQFETLQVENIHLGNIQIETL
ncbi:zinc finger protein 574 [Bombina bombina]|uniref:zinc finger protein 574 n=1 Tax=Bombina bombina TaxID=8345 RepID=UPI00235AF81F|nr:zinc finger protein 574 [Bombina bombina]